MFCPNCGTEAKPGQKFCMNCGTALTLPVEAAAPAEPAEVTAPVEPAEVAAPVEPVEAPAPVETPAPAEEADAFQLPTPVEHVEEPVVEDVAPEASAPAPEPSGTVIERIDLSTVNMGELVSAVDAIGNVPEAPTTVLPQPEPPQEASIPQPVDATLVQPIPQPVSEPAPVRGASPVNPQTSYAEPPAAAYTPQPVPQQPAKKAWYSSPVVPVLAGLLAFGAASSIAFRAVGGLFSSGSSQSESSPIEDVKPDVDDVESGDQTFSNLIEQVDSSASGTDSGSAPISATPKSDYLNSNAYPTLLAYMELPGSDLASLVESNGYFFTEEEDINYYGKVGGHIIFTVLTDEGYLDEDGYADLSAGGKDEGAVYITVLDGYDSPDAVLEGITNQDCTISDHKAVNDKESLAVVYGPSNREYLVDIYDVEDGDYEIDLYSPEAIAYGYFDVVNEGEFGSTASEVLKNYNG